MKNFTKLNSSVYGTCNTTYNSCQERYNSINSQFSWNNCSSNNQNACNKSKCCNSQRNSDCCKSNSNEPDNQSLQYTYDKYGIANGITFGHIDQNQQILELMASRIGGTAKINFNGTQIYGTVSTDCYDSDDCDSNIECDDGSCKTHCDECNCSCLDNNCEECKSTESCNCNDDDCCNHQTQDNYNHKQHNLNNGCVTDFISAQKQEKRCSITFTDVVYLFATSKEDRLYAKFTKPITYKTCLEPNDRQCELF